MSIRAEFVLLGLCYYTSYFSSSKSPFLMQDTVHIWKKAEGSSAKHLKYLTKEECYRAKRVLWFRANALKNPVLAKIKLTYCTFSYKLLMSNSDALQTNLSHLILMDKPATSRAFPNTWLLCRTRWTWKLRKMSSYGEKCETRHFNLARRKMCVQQEKVPVCWCWN